MTDQPNIVLVLIDDLGWKDLGCYGSEFYETPNLDRLSAEGLRFTDAYAASPVCSPTRAAILSGKYPARVGVTQFIGGHAVGRLRDVPYHHVLPLSEVSVAEALRRGGYQTWHVGKWHLGDGPSAPERHGFDVNIGGCGWGMPHQGYYAPFGMPGLEDTPGGAYLTDVLTDHAIRLVGERDRSRPFFLNLWHYAVHTPIQAPEDLVGKYRQKARDLGLDDERALQPGEFFPFEHRQDRRIVRRILQSNAAYAAMIENLDANMGRLLDSLEREGLTEQTLLLFSSDNGGLSTSEGSPTCVLPLAEGKGWVYEGGNRVCQLARWPGTIPAGSVTDVPVTSTDFYPTLLDIAGLPPRPRQHCDGVSLARLLTSGEAPERKAIFWHYPHYSNQGGTPACAIRSGDWKVIEEFEDQSLKLYNLRSDIGERVDLSRDEPERVAALHQRLADWRDEVEALIPGRNPNWVEDPLSKSPAPHSVSTQEEP